MCVNVFIIDVGLSANDRFKGKLDKNICKIRTGNVRVSCRNVNSRIPVEIGVMPVDFKKLYLLPKLRILPAEFNNIIAGMIEICFKNEEMKVNLGFPRGPRLR